MKIKFNVLSKNGKVVIGYSPRCLSATLASLIQHDLVMVIGNGRRRTESVEAQKRTPDLFRDKNVRESFGRT